MKKHIQKKKKKSNSIVGIFVLASVCSVIVVPLIYIISISLSSDTDIVEYGYQIIPKNISVQAYKQVFATASTIIRSYGVTMFVTLIGTTMSLFLTTTIAYVVSRKDFAYRKILSMYLVLPLLFNGGMVSSYIINTQVLHLNNTIWALILPYGVNVWFAFMMKGFLSKLPFEMIESAKIDGAGEYRIFFQIILPLSKASLATIGLFYMFAFWNDWWLAMLYISDVKLMPLQQLLQRIMTNIEFYTSMLPAGMTVAGGGVPVESTRMALAAVAAAPMLLVFPFIQRYFIKGVTVGSVKG